MSRRFGSHDKHRVTGAASPRYAPRTTVVDAHYDEREDKYHPVHVHFYQMKRKCGYTRDDGNIVIREDLYEPRSDDQYDSKCIRTQEFMDHINEKFSSPRPLTPNVHVPRSEPKSADQIKEEVDKLLNKNGSSDPKQKPFPWLYVGGVVGSIVLGAIFFSWRKS